MSEKFSLDSSVKSYEMVTLKSQKSRKDINLTQISQIPQIIYILRNIGIKEFFRLLMDDEFHFIGRTLKTPSSENRAKLV